MVKEAELTDREDAILNTLSDKAFLFDFKVEDDYQGVTVWIEKYESGKFVNEIGSIGSSLKEKEGTIVFTTEKNPDEQNEGTYHIGIHTSGGVGTGTGNENFPDNVPNMSTTWGNIMDEGIPINEGELVLAGIGYSDKNSIYGFTTSFFENPESHMSDLEQYNVAYLLKVQFTKSNISEIDRE
ncbi:hypothetical protein GCM10008025_20970 [Ornithinibacillus halotolerans]|uniref:Uncharacterized protein n=2 Tax=Ornithinibacillus halotolerans TaxID=1274357 RepID=A0A916RYZ8_9BACI|nr:hypothetical protein GCM10008025_20970 [Ornithinibacillus halotolerans]